MAALKCWTITVGERRGARVRVFERKPGGALYVTVWVPGRGPSTRSLRHADRDRAIREAEALVAVRVRRLAQPYASARGAPVTLLKLVAGYLIDLRYRHDGSLTTRRYLRESKQRAKYLLAWCRDRFGYHVEAERITIAHAKEYARARREGYPRGRPVRARTVQADLKLLKAVLAWAARADFHGEPLITRNRLAGWTIPRERDVRRPLIDDQTILRLRLVAPRVHPLLPPLIVLMESTGRRLSSVLALKWADFDFERRLIRWRADHDKLRMTWETPMPARAEAALLALQTRRESTRSDFVFAHPRKPGAPVTRHLAADWLKRAYQSAGVEREKGGLWHPFRRHWATARKGFPVKDVAAAGGWKDTQTILTCYVHPDLETMRAVMEGPQKDGRVSQLQLSQELTHLRNARKAPRQQARKARHHNAF